MLGVHISIVSSLVVEAAASTGVLGLLMRKALESACVAWGKIAVTIEFERLRSEVRSSWPR